MPQSNKENKQQIKELIKLNDELENYFQNTIIPQLFVDADLILRKFTPPAMKVFRLSPDHIGKPLEELTDNIRYSTIIEDIKEVIESGDILEKEIQTDDRKWFQMNIIPYIVQKNKSTNGVIITFVDITDRIKVLKDLERLNSSHETFIYSDSHDLKSPLANIQGLVQHLIHTSAELVQACGEGNKELKAIAAMLNKSVISMRTIINELSDISKIEGNYQETEEPIRFEDILTEVKLTLRDKIMESRALIHTSIQAPEINFSRKNLRSILYNLLSNAIKYKSKDRAPEISIETEKQKDFVLLTVKDNGVGFPEDKKDLIFVPFTRYEKNVEGTGIGLYLIKKIIENAGGKLEVNSKPGEGSEFSIYLKAATPKK